MANFDDDNIQFEVDLQDYFGFPRGTGIGYMITHAGADGRINKWAKYKPVRNGTKVQITDAQRKASHHGLGVNATINPANMPYDLLNMYTTDGENKWVYLYPRGGSYEEWFRAKDFLHYKEAPNPVTRYTAMSSLVWDEQPTQPFNVASLIAAHNSDGKGIEMTDLEAVLGAAAGNLYFGVAIFKGTGLTPSTAANVRQEIVTSNAPLQYNSSQGVYGGTSVSFSKTGMSSLDAGQWTIVPFLCVGAITQWGTWGGTAQGTKYFYPVPNASLSTLVIQSRSDTYVIQFDGTKNLNLDATVTIRNTGTTARSFTLSCYYCDSTKGSPSGRALLSYEMQFDLTGQSVAAGSTYTWSLPTAGRHPQSQLVSVAVAWIQVSGEGSIRGPFSFRQPI